MAKIMLFIVSTILLFYGKRNYSDDFCILFMQTVAKDLKTFERYLTTDLKPPRSIPHRVLGKTSKDILTAIDVILFAGIL